MLAAQETSTFIREPDPFLSWLHIRMEAQAPFYLIPEDLNQRCDQFLADLRSEKRLTFAPLTKNTLSRSLRGDASSTENRCRRSLTMLHYLAVIGTNLERQSDRVAYTVGDLISHALSAWPEHNEFIVVPYLDGQYGRNRAYHAISKPRAITDPEILISVPFVAPGARLRFGEQFYLRGLPSVPKVI